MIKELKKALKEDPHFYYCWQANIAMSVKDEYGRARGKGKYIGYHQIHDIANQAAKNFLDILINN